MLIVLIVETILLQYLMKEVLQLDSSYWMFYVSCSNNSERSNFDFNQVIIFKDTVYLQEIIITLSKYYILVRVAVIRVPF